ncbi:RHS repeat-associated core domain-containing protein [Paenibacillus harenae]|uniref:RHS repeat-associated protein n=1 Tax=Paenibacillus harenae TaxID=306543 RepID=A0ABT9U4Q5_PAEHA|nr:RHS repeat-associated core domain-containing protein [Paenibacillus harenae]MDQ0062443.1 RHS repeat-associated protein [Paenibacillus harenae]MDQ0114631.1 RHS repeat-associated protein [Paenibacillus harenae]
MKVTFPDGFGEKYAYDMLGRRISKTQFNHTGSTQEVTQYTHKGDTWAITEERDDSGNVTKAYTFDANDRPLSITLEGQTFWYVYNGHGDVVALTDKDGKVAARYEYDAWGLVTRMYNGLGERVREGTGWIGDLGTGNGSPGSTQGPEDESGNTDPDYHPGIGNAAAEGTEGTDVTEVDEAASDAEDELSALLAELDIEPTADITTKLVKENPYRYAGYYWDRKTQYYYLQARYYDPRLARFISEDTYEGETENPLSLNQYVYVESNPLNYVDPSGMAPVLIGYVYIIEGPYSGVTSTYIGSTAQELKKRMGNHKWKEIVTHPDSTVHAIEIKAELVICKTKEEYLLLDTLKLIILPKLNILKPINQARLLGKKWILIRKNLVIGRQKEKHCGDI